jgi:CheY-like chemotaxis protein
VTSRRLLIVDEHEISRDVLHRVFTLRGYVCRAVETAALALSAVEDFAPDGIILELVFRLHAEVGLSRQLRDRARELGRSLVIVVVSAHDAPATLHDDEDVDGYLVKPAAASAIEQALGWRS